MLKLSDYDFYLPKKLIAQTPSPQRDSSRLLVVDRHNSCLKDSHFFDLHNSLKEGDVLVFNKTKVIPARLWGKKRSGGKVEVFLLTKLRDDMWECLVSSVSALGKNIYFAEGVEALVEKASSGKLLVEFFPKSDDLKDRLKKIGNTPLPPYIKREATKADSLRYQTIFAEDEGSVAAPTAGLHFTNELISKLEKRGIKICFLTLNVGYGTFAPLKDEDIKKNTLHSEFCHISEKTASIVNKTKAAGGRVIAVGTTSARALESFADGEKLTSGQKWTDIFIYPGKSFQIVDCLITNFHLPKSSLFVLVSAFANNRLIKRAYSYAIENSYRFYSYGDGMLIL